MTDDQLSHLCRLATVAVGYIRCDEFEADIALGVERHGETVRNTVNIYRILADAFVELAKRQGMTPTFRLRAHSQPVEAAHREWRTTMRQQTSDDLHHRLFVMPPDIEPVEARTRVDQWFGRDFGLGFVSCAAITALIVLGSYLL